MKSHRKTTTILGTAVAIVAVAAMMYASVVPAKATDGDINPQTGNPHPACGAGEPCTPQGTETGNPHIGTVIIGTHSWHLEIHMARQESRSATETLVQVDKANARSVNLPHFFLLPY